MKLVQTCTNIDERDASFFSVCQARYKSYTQRNIHISTIFDIIPIQCLSYSLAHSLSISEPPLLHSIIVSIIYMRGGHTDWHGRNADVTIYTYILYTRTSIFILTSIPKKTPRCTRANARDARVSVRNATQYRCLMWKMSVFEKKTEIMACGPRVSNQAYFVNERFPSKSAAFRKGDEQKPHIRFFAFPSMRVYFKSESHADQNV